MLALSEVLLVKVVELTVMPVPEKEAAAPETKLVPVMVTSWFAEPRARALGLVEDTVGAGAVDPTVVTLKHPAQVPDSPGRRGSAEGLSTLTSRAPGGASEATEMFAFSEVVLSNVVELTVMPLPENDALAPGWKLVPAMVTSRLVDP